MISEKKYRRLTGLVHVAVWLLFFFWPWLLFHSDLPQFPRFYVRYLIYPCMAMGIFYFNYCKWIRKYFFPRRILRFVTVNLIAIVVGVIAIHLWQKPVIDWFYGPSSHRPPVVPWFFIFQNFLNLAMIVVVALAFRVSVRWYESEIERQALAKEKNLVELKNLKSQLHPHFLFNTLNNIYALITIDPDKARAAVYDLGSLLRYVLKERERDEAPLGDEVSFMRNYIALMSLRLGTRTDLRVDLPDPEEAGNYCVPSLLFINLIENAFKYGSGTQESSFIEIGLKPDPERNVLSFSCRNSSGGREKQYLLQEDTGVGLANLHKRLEYIYGTEYHFRAEAEGDIYVAELTIPLKRKV